MADRELGHPNPDRDRPQLQAQARDDPKDERARKLDENRREFQEYVKKNFPVEPPEIKKLRHKFWLAWGMLWTFFVFSGDLVMHWLKVSPAMGGPIVAMAALLISTFLAPYY